jgi:hypothetical protein
MLECDGREYSTGDVDTQEDNDEEDKDDSRSLIRGM